MSDSDKLPPRTFVVADLYFPVAVRKAIAKTVRAAMAGGDPATWRYDDFTRRMRRYVNEAWEARDATKEEIEAASSERAW